RRPAGGRVVLAVAVARQVHRRDAVVRDTDPGGTEAVVAVRVGGAAVLAARAGRVALVRPTRAGGARQAAPRAVAGRDGEQRRAGAARRPTRGSDTPFTAGARAVTESVVPAAGRRRGGALVVKVRPGDLGGAGPLRADAVAGHAGPVAGVLAADAVDAEAALAGARAAAGRAVRLLRDAAAVRAKVARAAIRVADADLEAAAVAADVGAARRGAAGHPGARAVAGRGGRVRRAGAGLGAAGGGRPVERASASAVAHAAVTAGRGRVRRAVAVGIRPRRDRRAGTVRPTRLGGRAGHAEAGAGALAADAVDAEVARALAARDAGGAVR